MKQAGKLSILFLLLIITSAAFAQEDYSGTIKVRKAKDLQPRIAGRTGGDIPSWMICYGNGIYVTEDSINILGYEITYPKSSGEYTLEVEGNNIPQIICNDLSNLKNGDQISFEKILAEDQLGRKFNLLPMRFDIIEDTVTIKNPVILLNNTTNLNGNGGKEIGMYQQKLAYIPMNKRYIKLGPDSTAFIVNSPGEPVVLNQVLVSNYNQRNVYHGTYSMRGDSIYIDFNPGYSDWDYYGIYQPGGLILTPTDQEGNPVALTDGPQRFFILPFSKR